MSNNLLTISYITNTGLLVLENTLVFADKVISLLRSKPRVMRTIDYTFAGLFSAFAIRILATSAR